MPPTSGKAASACCWRTARSWPGNTPQQGWFPKYAGGQYTLDSMTLIVSRGLARESTRLPRVFNRPELVIITVE